MKLTIIPIDGAVYENGLCYSDLVWEGTPADVHALQWQDIEGWIEYNDVAIPNENITVLPQWADNAMAAWTVANTPLPPPIPVPPTAEENKATASALLTSTDWTTIPDVADPANSPYLVNQAEFITYRNLVRQIAVYPTAGDLVWPIKPDEVWK
jgi:hypothetical protein